MTQPTLLESEPSPMPELERARKAHEAAQAEVERMMSAEDRTEQTVLAAMSRAHACAARVRALENEAVRRAK